MEQKTIWAVLATEAYQPENNLVIFWHEKPDFEVFLAAMDVTLDLKKDVLQLIWEHGDALTRLSQIYHGETARWSGADYRLQEIKPGIKL